MAFPRKSPILIRSLILLPFFSLSFAASSQTAKYEDILAFAQPWIQPQDYAWQRESTSRIQGDQEPGLRIKDVGRLRVEFVKFADESAILNIRILQYKFETQLKGEKPFSGTSPLQGHLLPTAFLHWALGFSLDVEPGMNLPKPVSGQQASQVFDLVDFRGLIPVEPLRPGHDWSLKLVPDRGKDFRFKEELERSFHCDSSKVESGKTRCGVRFTEVFKITPAQEGGNWELTEREGNYWISLPKGLIESAEWKTHSTESMKAATGSTKVMTETTVSLARVDVPFSNTKKPKASKQQEMPGRVQKELSLPPR